MASVMAHRMLLLLLAMVTQARSIHPLLLFAQRETKPGELEPMSFDAGASERLARAVRDYVDEPDLAEGIRALGAFAARLARDGSPSAGRALVLALERLGPELDRRLDAAEIAAALDEVGLAACTFE